MRHGIFLMGSRAAGYSDVVDQAARAEELGFHRIVLGERHFRHAGLLFPSPTLLAAAIAARTSRLRIGLAGRLLSLDHPLHVAESAATVDVLSGGRLDFGMARASLDDEGHRVFGPAREDAGARTEEALEVVLRAWSGEPFAHEGPCFSIPEVAVFPVPVQRPHPPVFQVAVSDASLERAARAGRSAVIGALRPLPAVADALARFTRHAPGEAEVQVNRFVYVGESDTATEREFAGPFREFIAHHAPDLRAALEATYGCEGPPPFARMAEDFLLVGGPDRVAEGVRRLREEAGVTSLLSTFNFVTLDHAAALRSLERFATRVM